MCILIFQYYTLFNLSLNLNKCMSECKEMTFLSKDAAQKLMMFSKTVKINGTRAGSNGDGLRITEKKVGPISFQNPFLGCPWVGHQNFFCFKGQADGMPVACDVNSEKCLVFQLIIQIFFFKIFKKIFFFNFFENFEKQF